MLKMSAQLNIREYRIVVIPARNQDKSIVYGEEIITCEVQHVRVMRTKSIALSTYCKRIPGKGRHQHKVPIEQ
jgi:hypothetical protein